MSGISREKLEQAKKDSAGFSAPVDESNVIHIIERLLEDDPKESKYMCKMCHGWMYFEGSATVDKEYKFQCENCCFSDWFEIPTQLKEVNVLLDRIDSLKQKLLVAVVGLQEIADDWTAQNDHEHVVVGAYNRLREKARKTIFEINQIKIK